MTVPVTGPGMLHFWYKGDPESTFLTLRMGGYSLSVTANGTDWREVSVPVPVDDTGSSPALVQFELDSLGEVLIDELHVVSSGTAVLLTEALDVPNLTWKGGFDWVIVKVLRFQRAEFQIRRREKRAGGHPLYRTNCRIDCS